VQQPGRLARRRRRCRSGAIGSSGGAMHCRWAAQGPLDQTRGTLERIPRDKCERRHHGGGINGQRGDRSLGAGRLLHRMTDWQSPRRVTVRSYLDGRIVDRVTAVVKRIREQPKSDSALREAAECAVPE
jgi:hypothetical protein